MSQTSYVPRTMQERDANSIFFDWLLCNFFSGRAAPVGYNLYAAVPMQKAEIF